MEQLNLFELTQEPYRITKPIRLIELFAGIGAQAQALKKLGVNFSHHRVVEIDKYAMDSYNAIHHTQFQVSDITKVNAQDLDIVELDTYEYIMTYSFPCQDLSKAGKGRGMKKGSGTRSGLLWEVERILKECESLPQILLMENVPDVIGKKNIEEFQLWLKTLEELGYNNYIECLNSKNYGVPQTRNRAYMVSIQGEKYYKFPQPIQLQHKLKDLLEDEVDSSYYLTEEQLQRVLCSKYDQGKRFMNVDYICHTLTTKTTMIIGNVNPSGRGMNGNVYHGDVAPTLTANHGEGVKMLMEGLYIPENTKQGYTVASDGDGIYIDRPHQKRGVVQKDMIQTLKTSCYDVAVVLGATEKKFKNAFYIRKLTPHECWRLMGFDDESFYKAEKVCSKTQLYKQAGNSIVVDVLEAIFKQFFIKDENEMEE